MLIPAFAVNRTKRLINSPKAYWSDTGLGVFLAGETQPRGAHLENLAVIDLLAWRDTQAGRPEVMYWRTTKGAEVDLVVEWEGRLLPIEIKTADAVRMSDAHHLQTFRREYPESLPGLVLYNGPDTFWLAEGILALPWWQVF